MQPLSNLSGEHQIPIENTTSGFDASQVSDLKNNKFEIHAQPPGTSNSKRPKFISPGHEGKKRLA